MNKTDKNIEKLKEEILETSYELFFENGYSNTSISDIAEHCNISRTPIYYHFKNKENLYTKALEITLKKTDKRLDNILFSDKQLVEKFDEIVDFFIKHSHELYRWQLDINTSAPKKAVKRYKEFLKRQFEKIESIIEIERVKIGRKGNLSSKSLTINLYLMFNGFCQIINSGYFDMDIEECREYFREFIEMGI